jgi:CspA family cold shock protein
LVIESLERGRLAAPVGYGKFREMVVRGHVKWFDTTKVPLPPAEASGPLEPARVKWFDRVKGFGFVNIFGRPEDVFLHMETLRQYGYGEVVANDVLAVRVTAGPRGPMVYEVRSWDYVVRLRMQQGDPVT